MIDWMPLYGCFFWDGRRLIYAPDMDGGDGEPKLVLTADGKQAQVRTRREAGAACRTCSTGIGAGETYAITPSGDTYCLACVTTGGEE